LYELKFDGYRVQLHKAGLSSAIYGKNGGDFSRRFPAVAAAVLGLPTKSCIIDGELIAACRHGQPDFLALLHGRHVPTCVYCFESQVKTAVQARNDRELAQRLAQAELVTSAP
jgi:bifunctional non-homologous end joining protein LigD